MNNNKPNTPDAHSWRRIFSHIATSLKIPEDRPDVAYFPADTLVSDAEGNRKVLYDLYGSRVVCPIHPNETVLCSTLVVRDYTTGFDCPKCEKVYWALPEWQAACRQCGIPESLYSMHEYGFCYECCSADTVSGSPNGEPMQ